MAGITKTATVSTVLKAANMQEDGQLACIFEVYTDDVVTNALALLVPETATSSIMDSTITDGKSIKAALTERIYNHFVGTGEIVGTLTA